MRIGGDNERNTFWVLPVEAEDPDLLIQTLRNRGFDATAKASSLIRLQDNSNSEPSQTNLSLGNIVYLPAYPQMTARKKLQLLQAIETYFRS